MELRTRMTLDLMREFEDKFRASNTEHAMLVSATGVILVVRDGDSDEVKFAPHELEQASSGRLTHNHPHCLPPSCKDLVVAAKYGLVLRAVGVTPENEHIDYTVRMLAPSETLATNIQRNYDNELERAEIELSKQAWDDSKWERESRHLAISRLAEQFGFSYQRHIKSQPVSEMRPSERKRADLFADVDMIVSQEVFAPVHAQLVRLMTRNATIKGIVPIERMMAVRREAEKIITHAMLGKPEQDGSLKPYKVHHNGEIMPDSSYFATLWRLMRRASEIAIEYHADLMREHLPHDLVRQFEMATISPFVTSSRVQEMDDKAPELSYNPMRRWADGRTLSDRIWNATGDMRRKLDEYLAAAISTNMPITQIAKGLEDFLLPGNGTYEAMRLAHTEVSAAHSLADFTAAQMNPLIDTYTPHVSANHKGNDGCDIQQANGPYPKSDPSHLPPFHPWCECGITWNLKNDNSVIKALRQQIAQSLSNAKQSIADYIGPLSKRFINFMFGESK